MKIIGKAVKVIYGGLLVVGIKAIKRAGMFESISKTRKFQKMSTWFLSHLKNLGRSSNYSIIELKVFEKGVGLC